MPPPGRECVSRPAPGPRTIPTSAPNAASPASLAASVPASPAEARMKKKSTNGSASPSLRPDSRFRACRTEAGTRCDVTTDEVTTGSVAANTEPSRKASGQLSDEKSSFAASASRTRVSGIAMISARATGPQWTTSISRSTNSPSESSVTISASSKRWTTAVSPAYTWIASTSARTSPAVTESTAIESTVPRMSPESAAAIASRPPANNIAVPNPTSMTGLYREAGRPPDGAHPVLTQTGARGDPDEVPLMKQLGDLHRVGRGALAKVVADHPEVEAALVRGVAPNPPDEHLIAASGRDRQRVDPSARIVEDDEAGELREQLPAFLGREVLGGLDVDRLRVAGDDRNPRTGRRDADVLGEPEDLPRLPHHLALFGRVIVAVLEVLHLGQHVEGDLVRIDLGRVDLLALQNRLGLGAQLLDRLTAGARDRLVSGDDQPLDARRVQDRLERDHHLHRRAVGVGDQPIVAVDRIVVHDGHHQRDVIVHPPVAGVVDHHRAGLDPLRRPLRAHRAAGRGEDQVELLDRFVGHLLHLELRAGEVDLAAGRPGGGQRPHLGRRELPLREHPQDRRAVGTGGAGDPDSAFALRAHAQRVRIRTGLLLPLLLLALRLGRPRLLALLVLLALLLMRGRRHRRGAGWAGGARRRLTGAGLLHLERADIRPVATRGVRQARELHGARKLALIGGVRVEAVVARVDRGAVVRERNRLSRSTVAAEHPEQRVGRQIAGEWRREATLAARAVVDVESLGVDRPRAVQSAATRVGEDRVAHHDRRPLRDQVRAIDRRSRAGRAVEGERAASDRQAAAHPPDRGAGLGPGGIVHVADVVRDGAQLDHDDAHTGGERASRGARVTSTLIRRRGVPADRALDDVGVLVRVDPGGGLRLPAPVIGRGRRVAGDRGVREIDGRSAFPEDRTARIGATGGVAVVGRADGVVVDEGVIERNGAGLYRNRTAIGELGTASGPRQGAFGDADVGQRQITVAHVDAAAAEAGARDVGVFDGQPGN